MKHDNQPGDSVGRYEQLGRGGGGMRNDSIRPPPLNFVSPRISQTTFAVSVSHSRFSNRNQQASRDSPFGARFLYVAGRANEAMTLSHRGPGLTATFIHQFRSPPPNNSHASQGARQIQRKRAFRFAVGQGLVSNLLRGSGMKYSRMLSGYL
jgi:hypothetical protein